MLGGAASPGGEDLLTVTIVRDEHGYGMKVSGDNPVYVQSVKEHGAAWRAGLRAGDRILRVDTVPVHRHTHQQVVQMIRANPTTVLTVQQNSSRHKTPITAPVPVNPEKQRQLEVSKLYTMRLMLEQEQKYIRDLRNELCKVPDVRKQTQLESAELRCSKLKQQIDAVSASQPSPIRGRGDNKPNSGFLSGLPRSLSNLTGQSLRNLRNARNRNEQSPALLQRHDSDESTESTERRHNNTVPLVPTTCLDNASPPPLPPRSIERPKRVPLSPPPPLNPLAKPKPSTSNGRPLDPFPMHRSMPPYRADLLRSSQSLDGGAGDAGEGPEPNSIAMQMSYPLVNVPPPPLQTDNRSSLPVLHMRSRSSPEQLEIESPRPLPPTPVPAPAMCVDQPWTRGTPPPGTPPPPYAHNTQPCADPQRAIISMEEDDSPASDNSTYSGLFSNLRSVRESRARTAVLLNWLLGERRCACANLLLILTDGYRNAAGVSNATLRRWAYEIQSTFLIPSAVLQLNGVDENMANEIEHVLVNEYEKEELLRNVFRKARQKAKDELSQQLSEFQVKRQVGLGTLYGPEDSLLEKCDVDKAQELVVVERLLCQRLTSISRGEWGAVGGCGCASPEAHAALLAALVACALCLHCRPASVAAAVGGSRAAFLQRDKLYKQRLKQLAKQHPQPYVVRGHHLQLQALTSVAHCHHCDHVIWGLAPQAVVCTDCKLRVHRSCARHVEEGCCLDGDHHNNRISRFMDRIHNPANNLDSSDKKSRKASSTGHFLNMERSFRKQEDEQPWDQTLTPASSIERRDESDESLYESADCHSDAISASDDALPRLGKTPTLSKESLKLAITDEEVDLRTKKGHRKTMSLSNPIEMVKSLGDEWFESTKKELEKNSDKKKSKESLWSEEDRDSIHGSNMKLDQIRKNSKKEDKSLSNSRKSSTTDAPKTRKSSKGSSVSALNFLRRKKTPTSMKPVESVSEDVVDNLGSIEEILNYTKLFLDGEKRHSSICETKPPQETDSDDEAPATKVIGEHRRRLSRQTSRSKSKVRGKSQSLKVNTLRKSHSGTLKKAKKKNMKTPSSGRSRQSSIVEHTPIVKKKYSDSIKHNSWFSGSKGEPKREGSADEQPAPEADVDTSDTAAKDAPDKDNNWRTTASGGRGVNRAESCRERDAPRRGGKHRNASDPNRLTAHNNHDLEPGAVTAPSGSSSSSSLSSRSNESNTVAADQQASQSEWSEEEEPLAAQWADSLPSHVLDSLQLSSRIRKRQEVIHELIVSEGSHVRWLKVLCRVFLRPLEAAPSLLPAEELRQLFPNLPDVRDWHCALHARLRNARSNAIEHQVALRDVALALLGTLGEPSYAACLSRFCRGQRLALESLRERRRKNKELHQFLSTREQLPLCGRLQLRDLLACVWQRLTKYRLLLESVLKTVSEDEDAAEDVDLLQKALDRAKDMLLSVDQAIRATENEHRLRNIQAKLEVRAGNEWDELRRLELPSRRLRLEGELTLRLDQHKKTAVLALMFEDMLVLLQKEGDKFLLKPLPHQHGLLSPLIKWDKVLFRPNAAVRNTFFLMNINGVQMHELSANTAAEYATWVNCIQEAPLAKVELKQTITPSHQPTRSTDDEGTTNVSRNPSDASEKSIATTDEPESDKDRTPGPPECERESTPAEERDEKPELDVKEKEETLDKEEKLIPRGGVGVVSTQPALEQPPALTVVPPAPAHTATTVCTYTERLRRLDEGIEAALRAKAAIVGEVLGVPETLQQHFSELAIADTLGQVDVRNELRATRQSSMESSEEELIDSPDVRQLLLAAHAQASQLTQAISRALSVNEAAALAARTRRGRCDRCRQRTDSNESSEKVVAGELLDPALEKQVADSMSALERGLHSEPTIDATDVEGDAERALESNASAAILAARVSSLSSGLQGAVRGLLDALPAIELRAVQARRQLALAREREDRIHHADYQMTDEIYFLKPEAEQPIQDQPSNGG